MTKKIKKLFFYDFDVKNAAKEVEKLRNKVDRMKFEMEVFRETISAFTSIEDIDRLLKIIVHNAKMISSADVVMYTPYDKKKKGIYLKVMAGFENPIVKKSLKILKLDPYDVFLPANQNSISKWMLENKKTFITDSLYIFFDKVFPKNLTDTVQKISGLKKMVCVPLIIKDDFVGEFVYMFTNVKDIDVPVLESFAFQCAQAINISHLVNDLKSHTQKLEKMNKFMVGRETEMAKLKKRVRELEQKSKK